jgi:hypothetical protein
VVLAGWRGVPPHPTAAEEDYAVVRQAEWLGFGRRRDPWQILLLASGRLPSWAGRLPSLAGRGGGPRPRRVR